MAAFDDSALSSLTAKIDRKLSEKSFGNNKKSPATTPAKQNLKRKRPEEKPEQAVKAKNEKPKQDVKGNKKDKKDKKKATNSVQDGVSTSDALLEEIRALGGDEKDLELVGDIDSEEEDLEGNNTGTKPDKGFQAELAQFASGLGFEKVKPEEAAEEEDEESEGESELEEEEEDDDDAEDSPPLSKKKDTPPVPKKKETPPVPKKKENPPQPAPKAKGKWKTIFEPRPDWHAADLVNLPDPSSDAVAPYMSSIANLKAYAKSVLDEDSATYSTTLSASSSHKFMSTIMSSGTVSDKTSALTLAIMESPVHSVKSLENLMALAAKRSRGQAISASAALVDLLGPGTLLPPNRRLRTFATQSGLLGTLQKHKVKSWTSNQGLPGMIDKEHLISWIFEDWLKESYFKIIQTLETWCDDEVEYSRLRSVDMVYALLKDKPEQESNLLRLLANKLGDRERKISSRASYLLLQLLNIHPGMKAVVVRTVEQEVIFRQGQNIRAKYYAVNTLNQTILSSKEPQIADSLLNIYFGMFVSLLKSGDLGQIDGTSTEPKPKSKKRRRTSQPSQKPEEVALTGEKEAAEKLTSAILTGINRAVPFSETDSSTLESHLDTLFKITHSSNFNTSIQALMLIQQLSATRHLATDRFYRTLYESLLDPRLTTSSKQALYLNLLYRSLKTDVDVRRVKAFVKRMLQILNLHQPSFVCGIIFLTMELYGTFPDLTTLLNEPEEYDEVDESAEALGQTGSTDDQVSQPPKYADVYDGRKRVPEYSNAHRSCLWELLPFLRHYHPSVDLFASSLLNGQKPAQKPDLANHTLINFLDKFVYKNPKAGDTTRGNSLMQPLAGNGQGSVLVSSKPTGKAGSSLNSAAFWNKKAEDVAADDVFFHEYFSQMGKPGQTERIKKVKQDGSDIGDNDSVAGEDEIWDALVTSRPEVQGDEEESELGSDFEEMMGLDESDEDLDDEDDDAMDVDGASDGSALDFSDASSLGFSDEEEDSDGGAPTAQTKTDDAKPESEQKKRRKMLKGLPTFASADDYAEMLAQEADDV